MPLQFGARPTAIPILNEPAKVLTLTILVGVMCQQCDSGSRLALVNEQPAVCPNCGALIALDVVHWEKGQPTPQITLSTSPPSRPLVTA